MSLTGPTAWLGSTYIYIGMLIYWSCTCSGVQRCLLAIVLLDRVFGCVVTSLLSCTSSCWRASSQVNSLQGNNWARSWTRGKTRHQSERASPVPLRGAGMLTTLHRCPQSSFSWDAAQNNLSSWNINLKNDDDVWSTGCEKGFKSIAAWSFT